MLEKGLQFGNNGDSPDKLTSDIMDTSGDASWPISTFSYVIIRNGLQSDRLREGATCANVQATVEFWHWSVLSTKASSLEFASPFILTEFELMQGILVRNRQRDHRAKLLCALA